VAVLLNLDTTPVQLHTTPFQTGECHGVRDSSYLGTKSQNPPDHAHKYMLGPRSALDWLIERYQVKSDKASGIVNDPNTWCDEHDRSHLHR
jgi:Type ISP C-terminal specificity domain